MEPVRTWTLAGEKPLTISVYKPAVTIRFGDGPEGELSPTQVSELSSRFADLDTFFQCEDAELL